MKAMVLFSGGIDSTTCLALAIEKFGKQNVIPLSITYGQKYNKEITAAGNAYPDCSQPFNEAINNAIYEGATKPCRKCGTCIDREKAFQLNGHIDPLLKNDL